MAEDRQRPERKNSGKMNLFTLIAAITIFLTSHTSYAQRQYFGRTYSEDELVAWYKRLAPTYAQLEGQLVAVKDCPWLVLIEGRIFQVPEEKIVLIRLAPDTEINIVALSTWDSDKAVDGMKVRCIGRRSGIYEYTAVNSTVTRVPRYEHVPMMSYEQFRVLLTQTNGGAFPEMEADAKRQDAQEAAERVQSENPKRRGKTDDSRLKRAEDFR